MNYNQAMVIVRDGGMVRLPEWTGYWFKGDNGAIKAFTRTGDIVPAWTGSREETSVCDRNDWQEASGALGFDFAILALKAGKKLCRAGWNGKGMYIFMQKGYPEGIAINKNTAEATGIPEGTVTRITPYLMMRAADGTLVTGWLASQTDMLATDWQIAAS